MSSASPLIKPKLAYFHSALQSCVQTQNPTKVLTLFRHLLRSHLRPNDSTFSLQIKAYTLHVSSSSFNRIHTKLEADQIRSHLVKTGINQFVNLSTAVLDLYMKLGLKSCARKLFVDIPEKDTVSWNALICGYSRLGCSSEAVALFVTMLREGFCPCPSTLVGLAPSLGGRNELFIGRLIHCFGIKAGLDLNSRVKNALTMMYARFGEVGSAEILFEEIDEKSVVSWNTMVSAFGKNGYFDEAMLIFKRMVEERVEANSVSLISVLSADANPENIHCYATKTGIEDDCVVTSLICTYSKHGDIKSSESLYESLLHKNLVSLTAILSNYAEEGNMDSVIKCFAEMQRLNMKLDAVAMISILHGITNHSSHFDMGLSLHCYVLKTGLCADPLAVNGLMSMYGMCNELEAVFLLFSEMHEKPLASWNTVISSCVQAGVPSDAIEYFGQMRIYGESPDKITIASLLSACSQNGYLHLGERLHNYVLRNHQELEDFVETTLIDMYSKCGSIVQAERVFKNIKVPSLATWNAIITGYSLCGFEHKALQSYCIMQKQGLRPDKITFLGLLSACMHGGLINEGKRFFNIMTQEFGIVPTLQHHACVVGLLGLAGLFEQALEHVKNMNVEPDSAVWGALLNACCIYQEVKLGECLAKKFLFLDQQNGGFYVLMSNLYALERKWDDVARVREMMKGNGEDGCYGASLIEVA